MTRAKNTRENLCGTASSGLFPVRHAHGKQSHVWLKTEVKLKSVKSISGNSWRSYERGKDIGMNEFWLERWKPCVATHVCGLNLSSECWGKHVTVAFLGYKEGVIKEAGRCFSEVSSVVRLGLHGDVNIRIVTLQERGFQEKHTSAKLYLWLLY